eukprot:745925-Hanusia_phi.AAC.2
MREEAVNDKDQDHTQIPQLIFLYKLVQGSSMDSNGYHCALKAGIPELIVQRAKAIASKLSNNEPIERFKEDDFRQRAVFIVNLFSKFEVETGNIQKFLEDIGC